MINFLPLSLTPLLFWSLVCYLLVPHAGLIFHDIYLGGSIRGRRQLVYYNFSFCGTCTESLIAKCSCTCAHTYTHTESLFNDGQTLQRKQTGREIKCYSPAHRSTSPNTISWIPVMATTSTSMGPLDILSKPAR